MWPQARVVWWDVTRWLALRASRVVAGVTLAAVAGSGFVTLESVASRPAGPDRAARAVPVDISVLEPNSPWSGRPSSPAPPSGMSATLVAPTQPWPGTTP